MPIKDLDAAPPVANQAPVVDGARGVCDGWPPRGQQIRKELVGQLELVTAQGVLDDQQVSAEPLFNGMVMIANRGLRNLDQKLVRMTQQR